MSRAKRILEELQKLNEALRPKDKKVVDAFFDKKSLEGKILLTDGTTLELTGFVGAAKVAKWENGKIKVLLPGLASKTQQSVLTYMKKSIPSFYTDDIKRFV